MAIGSSHDVGSAVAIQPDGKIVVAGFTESGDNLVIAVVRYRWTVGENAERALRAIGTPAPSKIR